MSRVIALLFVLIAAGSARAATDIQVVTSPGGITAWLVEERSIPMVAIDAFIEGGPLLDPPEAQGATNLMMALLEEGAGNYDSLGFAQAADALGARLRFSARRSGVDISATVLTENREESLSLLSLALNAPTFPQDAIERVRQQVLAGLKADETDPEAILSHSFRTAMLGDHVFARDISGTEETVAALTREALSDAHRRALVKDRLTVGVVGDIDAATLGPLLDRLFGDLPNSDMALPPAAEVNANASVEVLDLPSPESIARFAHPGILRDDPDYLAAYLAAQVFGGGALGSRLTEEVREKRGLTYGIWAGLSPSDYGPMVLAQVASANATIAEAIEVTRREWERIAREGITQEELDRAKRYLTGSYPLQFDGNRRIAGILTGMQLADLAPDYPKRRNSLVEALTLEEVNAVAARVFRPEALSVIVVGQPEGIETVSAQ